MAPSPCYDEIGLSYTATRREDPRIGAQIHAALGSGGPVLNVGAGTGNYEPVDETVVAVDPASRMLAQRTERSKLVVRGAAERLPSPDRAFRSALAVFTMQHWDDRRAGLRELRRVSQRQVIVFHEPTETTRLWMLDYFEEGVPVLTGQREQDIEVLQACLDVIELQPVPVPRDCVDGFGAAFWARPEAYLDPAVQAGISELASLPDQARAQWTARLRADLESGEWDRRYGDLRNMTEYDAGYRLAVAEN